MKKFVFFLFFSFLTAASLFAEDSALLQAAQGPEAQTLSFTSFPKEVKLAQDFSAFVTLPERAELDKDSYSQKDFEIISASPDESGLAIEIKAVPFALGVSTFTALSFTGYDGKRFVTEPVPTEVKSVDTGIKEEKLLDIRAPYRPFNYWILLWIFAIAAAVFAAYAFYLKRRPADKARLLKAFEEDKRPLDVIALDRLDHLLAGGLWHEGQYKFFYINMIDILRDYLSLRFAVDAHKYTSRDLIRVLKKTPAFKGDLKQLADLQRSADYVKFAKAEPTEAQRDADIRNMRNIIIDTRPPRLEAESKEKGA